MPTARRTRRKVFLSHSHKDRVFVERLAKVLGQHRVAYWYSETQIGGGEQWHDEIGRGLAQCNWFLVVLTPASVRKTRLNWVKRELLFAYKEPRYAEKIIPVLLKRCKYSQLSWLLDESQFVNFTRDFESGCQKLMQIWKIDFRTASAAGTAKLTGRKSAKKPAKKTRRRT